VFADDSTILVDAVSRTLRGNLIGSVFADDSSQIIDGNTATVYGNIEATTLKTSESKIALGLFAGNTNQGGFSIAVGRSAGQTDQGSRAIAIGQNAGAITQGGNGVAIGYNAGATTQAIGAIAIGSGAGETNQGVHAIAIGTGAGQTNQPANTIVLNASGAPLNAAQAGGMYVNPIRNDNANPNWLTYNAMSGEITFDTALPLSLGANTDAASLTTSVWAYAKQAEATAQTAQSNADTANTFNSNYTTANQPNVAGTSADTPSLATSLWAYAKQAEADAQVGITWITNATTPSAPGEIGTATDVASITTSLWAYAKQGVADAGMASGAVSQLITPNGDGNLGTSNDTPSLTTSAWAYAIQAEDTAQAALARTSFSTINVEAVRSPDGNTAILTPDSTMTIGTGLSRKIGIGAGGDIDISTGGDGNPHLLTLTSDTLKINVGSTYGAPGQVLTSDGLNASWVAIPPASPFSYNIYVSNISGSDITGTGAIGTPFQTIGAAMTFANLVPVGNQVSIILAAGTYTENVTLTRPFTFISGAATCLSTATRIDGKLTIDMTATALPSIIGGLSSVQINNIVYNNSVANSQSFLVSDCFILPPFGTSAISATDTSVGGNGDITIQSCLIYMSDTIAIQSSNVYLSIFACEIRNYPNLIYPTSLIETSGTGRIIMYNSILTQAYTAADVAPIINLANTSTTQFMVFSGNTIQYSSGASDAGNGNKCCIRCANSAAITAITVLNNTLICQGATTTTGVAGNFLAIQRTGAGTITINYGQNICGTTANHLPAAAAGLTKTAFVVLR
jgi:hypothetical protein